MAGPSSRPKRSLGQNFLVDANIQRKIVEALDARPEDEVLEIGPGRGALTRHLVGTVRRLILVELDDELVRGLREAYGARQDVSVVHGDILQIELSVVTDRPSALLVVGNIPYNITSPIIFHLLRRPRPKVVILMVQEDVADRIVAPVGTKAYGALSVGVRSVASVERLFKVPRRAFRPVPGVDSAVVRIRPAVPERLSEAEEEGLRVLVRAAFQWRRKQLRRILRDHPDLSYPTDTMERVARDLGLDLAERPERLSPEMFVRLSAALQ